MKWMIKPSMTLACALLVAASLTAVTPGFAITAQGSPAKSAKVKLSSLESIQVSGENDAAELVIKLSAPATFTSYKTSAPLRLVLDLSQTTQGNITSPVVLDKGNFKSVTVNRFDTDAGVLTRIYIELFKDAEHLISASKDRPGELKISFPVKKAVAEAPSTQPVSVPAPQPKADTTQTARPATPSPLHTLTDISADNNKVLLKVDGGTVDFKTFRLNKPERFVIDMSDTMSSIASRMIPLNAAGIASARIGLYPDKVRVVLDSLDGTFPETTANTTNEGIVLSLKNIPAENSHTKLVATQAAKEPVVTPKAPVVAEPVKKLSPPEPQPAAVVKPVAAEVAKKPAVEKEKAAAETGKPVVAKQPAKPAKTTGASAAVVEMIDFQVVDGISRVAVKISGDAVAEQPVKSPGFVTMTVKNVTIAKQLQRSLDAHSFISPVLRITPLVVKHKKGSDVKIRISMRTPAPFTFRQEGDMYYVDFTNPNGLAAEKLSEEIKAPKPQTAKTVSPATTLDSAISTELDAPLSVNTQSPSYKKTYTGRKVTLEFADAEVRKIFQLLSEVSGKNFVLGDEVTGNISLKLVNVPWDQALDIIMDAKNLDMRDNGNVLTIKGKGKFKSQADEEAEFKKTLIKSIELKSATFAINYSTASEIENQIKPLLTPERGKTTIDARTNMVIVRDIPDVIDSIRKLIIQLDVPEKQVMIEARIVEATSTFTRSLGVNWGVHYRDGMASFLGINQLDTSFGGLASTAAPTSGLSGQSGGAMGISFGTLTSNISLDLRLNAAASAGLVRIVSTPKVATLNNKTAKITQGQQVPYTSSTSDKVETKFVEAALSLEVTPHINANGTIGMKIDAKNDSVGQSTGGSTAPAINKKQATTEMLLRDGETTVIGGIFVDSDNDSDDGVPYLMDIPLFGKLFKSNSKTKVKTELLIFITPRILTSI